MKTYNNRLLTGLSLLLSFLLIPACTDEKTTITINQEKIDLLKDQTLAGNLFLRYESTQDSIQLLFENDQKISITKEQIKDIIIEEEEWRTTLIFTDEEKLEIPSLGTKLNISTQKHIKLDPTGYAPLSALFTYSAPVEGRFSIRIETKNQNVPDFTYLFNKYGYNHQLEIHGLYMDHLNTVEIIFNDKNGNKRISETVEIRTEAIPEMILPEITLVYSDPSRMEPGMTLVSYIGDNEYDTSRPFMIDAAGEIRWALHLRNHPQLRYFAACSGLKRLKNGNFMTAGLTSGLIYELNMLGELINTWDIDQYGCEFHRDIIELPNGNFMLAVTKRGTMNSLGEYCEFDVMIEIDRETGGLVTEWDFKESLDEKRDTYTDKYETADWAHQNAIAYSEEDDAVIVSHRFQGMAKVTRRNNPVWILSPHKGWNTNGKGDRMASYLLQPLTFSGEKITDNDVLLGNKAHEEFDWGWGPHCPVLLPDNKLLIFDNGYYRHYNSDKTIAYSRAVEYQIDEANRTIRQTWEFGKELGMDGYSSIVSSVQYLAETDHILFGSGAIGFLGHGIAAQGGAVIMEVDYDTKEVVYEVRMKVPIFYVFHRVTRMSLYPEE